MWIMLRRILLLTSLESVYNMFIKLIANQHEVDNSELNITTAEYNR